MTTEQQLKIQKLRQLGQSYAKIAAALSISENTVKSYCRRNHIGISKKPIKHEVKESNINCKHCGKPLTQGTKGHPRKFCSEECRRAWWKENDSQYAKKAYYTLVCKECGKTFESYGNKTRKFCGHACYIKHRFEKARDEHDACSV
ncbi:MAG: RNA polymerase subunit sigma-70 [Bacillota bacterium]